MSMGKDPFLKIPHYCNEVLRATGEEKDLLTLCWRLAADAARNYSRQCQANYIFSPEDPPDLEKWAHQIKKTQEANYRLTVATALPPVQAFSSHWIFSVNELRGAAWSYRHWMIYSQARNSKHLELEIRQAQEAVMKYHLLATEVSRFAQESVDCFQRAQQLQQSLEKDLAVYRWKIAAYEAAHGAIIQLNLTAAKSWNNKILIHHWSEAARFASHAFYFRRKAAEATEQQEEMMAMHWSLAAYAASNACDSHTKLVEILPSGKERLITYWTETLRAAEQAMEKRHYVAALTDEKTRAYWAPVAFWAEYCYDCHIKRLELSLNSNMEESDGLTHAWEGIIQEAEQITSTWNRAAQQQDKKELRFFSYCRGKMARHLGYKNRKKIFESLWREFEMLWQDVSFCLAKPYFPDEECQKAWEQGKIFPKIEFTCSHSWIYQTARFLQQVTVPCDLSMYQKEYGVMIALCAAAPVSFGTNPPLSPDVFLVDVVADSLPHPAAHFYILQNPIHAQQVPNALFMPHWPQSRLIPRNPARGMRFENVVFFGDVENLAPELASVKWIQRLQQELGLTFSIQNPDQWNDYSRVDCVIAIRDFSTSLHLHKPATKLYNAWFAGVPFIGGRDSAYAFDGHSGRDYLVATSLEEVFQHLKRLQGDTTLRSMLVQNGFQSSKFFTQAATLERWKTLIQETLPALALKHQQKLERKRHRILFLNSFLHWVHLNVSH